MPAAPAQAREAVLAARAALLSAAAAFLEVAGFPEGPFTVILEAGGEERKIVAHERPPPTPMPAAECRRLSDLERKIVGRLRGRGWVVTADLAQAIGEEPTSDFRAVVRNLDGVVWETNTRLGVRLLEGA